MLENPAITALLGVALTGLLTLIGALLRFRYERQRHIREIAMQCARISHEAQMELVKIAPEKYHVLKPMTYWISYYMVLANRMSKDLKGVDDVKKLTDGMEDVEVFLHQQAVAATANQSAKLREQESAPNP